MNRKIFFCFAVLIITSSSFAIIAQNDSTILKNRRAMSFDEVISTARSQSPMAVTARHQFRSSYWEYRSYKAGYLPNLSMSATLPDLNRSIEKISLEAGDIFAERKQISAMGSLQLSQNIPFTGGNIYMSSDLQRIDFLSQDGGTSYLSNPVSIGLRQPINGYNQMKWEKLIGPLKYEEAKKDYINSLERVSLRAVNYFFDLALAQKNLEISHQNYSNADTLYKIAKGRYQLGTIAENELLQMELSMLNAGTSLNEAKIDLAIRKFQLNSFLGFGQADDIALIIPEEIPANEVLLSKALEEAKKNNPEVLARKRQLIEARQNVALSKSQKGLNADLFASFGLSQSGDKFDGIYMNPQQQERIRLGIEVPIMDWGLARGKYKMAQSAQEVVKTNVAQAEMDFEQEVLLQVMQFNLQDDQLQIAAKADTIARMRYEVSKQRFLIGKISVLDLNVALQEKDIATRAYIAALRNYWNYFFNMRSLTLFDWINNQSLSEEFDSLIR
jgi:outer membrane protein TolC